MKDRTKTRTQSPANEFAIKIKKFCSETLAALVCSGMVGICVYWWLAVLAEEVSKR